MIVTKNQNVITLQLTPEEDKAINALVKFRGNKGLKDALQAWLDTRVETAKDEERRSVYNRFTELTDEEKSAFLERRQLQNR